MTRQEHQMAARSALRVPDGCAIPSRQDNPFATCWTKPGAIAFRFEDGQSATKLVAKLASQNWMGAIVAPHGCGKSTLLETLKPALVAAGCRIQSITLRKGQWRLPRGFLRDCGTMADEVRHVVVVIDGFEQLGWFRRARIASFCRRRGVGLLVTSHHSCNVRTLIHLSPSRELIGQLVSDLCGGVLLAITAQDTDASYACHGSNVREIFFDLYDRHERLRRTLGIAASAR
jgi:hypothetical protein